jgi:hypothetical protein
MRGHLFTTEHTENTKVAQRVILITLVLFLLVSVPEPAPAQDTAPADNWSQFRGNQRLTGVSDSQVPENLKLLWTFDAGDSIESSAAIVGGTVFVGLAERGTCCAEPGQRFRLLALQDRRSDR